ncbi:MAG: LysR family transcriptional regulator [Pseudomonadota bacterium]
MSDSVSALRLFCRVARTESFTAAGKEIGLSQPSVSRIISKLETDLGAALFVRSTHAVKLTEAGTNYLGRIEPVLASLEEANHMVRGDGTLKGRLRVGCATSFAVREVIPRITEFVEAHPELKIDFVLTDSMQDLIDQAIDVAIRFGELADSTLVARKIGETPRMAIASPTYLEKAGTPEAPADLANHTVVVGPSGAGVTGWSFTKNGKTTSVRVEHQVSVTVNEAATAAAVSGLGVVTTSYWGCKEEIENGKLIQIFPDWEIGFVEVHAVLPSGRNAKPSARAFTDYLVKSFAKRA